MASLKTAEEITAAAFDGDVMTGYEQETAFNGDIMSQPSARFAMDGKIDHFDEENEMKEEFNRQQAKKSSLPSPWEAPSPKPF